jgi:3-polyprenyl-4-hydroxybenzoate decarboxylase
VVSLAAVVLERGADVKILELVVLVLVVREDADAVEDVIKDA